MTAGEELVVRLGLLANIAGPADGLEIGRFVSTASAEWNRMIHRVGIAVAVDAEAPFQFEDHQAQGFPWCRSVKPSPEFGWLRARIFAFQAKRRSRKVDQQPVSAVFATRNPLITNVLENLIARFRVFHRLSTGRIDQIVENFKHKNGLCTGVFHSLWTPTKFFIFT